MAKRKYETYASSAGSDIKYKKRSYEELLDYYTEKIVKSVYRYRKTRTESYYRQFEKKTIYRSLIGQKPGVYEHIRKAMRFWSCFCNYSYPIVQKEKYGINKHSINPSHQPTIKLPKLYTNSSKESRLSHSTTHVRKVKSVMDIFTKNHI